MNKQTFKYTRQLISFLIFMMLVIVSNAAADNRIGEVEALSDTLQFFPEVDYQQLNLTVVGAEIRWQESFGPGEVAVFSSQRTNLPDGPYRYELMAAPAVDEATQDFARYDFELMQELDRQERVSTFRQSGEFEVLSGEIFLDDDDEFLHLSNQSLEMQKGEK